jgi:allantoicase/malate synthase/CubicO group peptidase (beta-lactamase class C family)
MLARLKKEGRPVPGIPDLFEVGSGGGLENTDSLRFVCELYDALKGPLDKVLRQRQIDREFIDQRTKACFELNRSLKIDLLDPSYHTVIGHEDARGRIVMGPKNEYYCKPGGGKPVASLPKYLDENHVTLFGPPDDPKLSINAMNAYHRRLKNEPPIVKELLATHTSAPKWGADDEDSKTPLRRDLVSAGENLTGCFEGNLSFTDPKSGKRYDLEKEHRSLPIKRFPGLALPCLFLFYRDNPIPLHLYDFALHLFRNWRHENALSFYVPKLENEEEAAYIRLMVETAEKLLQKRHPEYRLGQVRLFIVLENPRAIFRVNEIMDALHPFFAGASLGWHDYLASTARIFKEDANYRIPVKADPDIVIKYIKASHNLLADVVGSRGGIKIGGMYGVLPMDTDLFGPSFQVTIKGFIKDVITQMKRDLSGYWVAHPDFVRIGLALVEAWKFHQRGDSAKLNELVTSLLDAKFHKEILDFIHGPDISGFDVDDPRYARSLIVADIKESNFIANNHPDEIRYNVFQSLQYLTDWLTGNGCVALPAQIEGVPVRVMDDLATAERSRWEVWHEIHHGRFSVEEFLKIAHEEMVFIRKDLSDGKKIVQVKWDERTEKWYPIALRLMIQLMTAKKPVEFASELLLPFTVDSIREAADPWAEMMKIDPDKYAIDPFVERFHHYFSVCGSLRFAREMAKNLSMDLGLGERIVKSFDLNEIIAAASFHGDIGESKKTLDEKASKEQALVLQEAEALKQQLRQAGDEYKRKFGVKFLISAQGKTGQEILQALKVRMNNPPEEELRNARQALWEISLKRLKANAEHALEKKIEAARLKHGVTGAQVCLTLSDGSRQTLCFGEAVKGEQPVTAQTWFELASLSKTLASCFALEYFKRRGISLDTPVNQLLASTSSAFRLKILGSGDPAWADQVTLAHLMNHTALNMHYVNGVPADRPMPNVRDLLEGNKTYDYVPVGVLHRPGETFQYSGGGFLVLEHLIEALEGKPIQEATKEFFAHFNLKNLTFEQKTLPQTSYADGYTDTGALIEGRRKMFPAFAAGAMGCAEDLSIFLLHLSRAYRSVVGSAAVSHDTAVRMLHAQDKGSRRFMGADMGLGVFVAEAGPNRLMIHQGANDGFRCLFVHCFAGPDAGKGFVIFCNADQKGVFFIAEAAQEILREMKWQGVDTNAFGFDFKTEGVPPEQAVNLGYKSLIFSAFQADLPEEIIDKGPLDPLAAFNLAVGGKMISVTNQGFARAENLLSPHLPVFDPELYGRQGKIMDSWETVRHNPRPSDDLVFELKKPSKIRFVSVSTKYHLGNQAPAVRIEGRDEESGTWLEIIPKTKLEGHAIKFLLSQSGSKVFREIRVSIFPDGGLTRIGLFDELPANEVSKFEAPASAKSHRFSDPIPHALKPLTPKYRLSDEQIQRNWTTLSPGEEVDVASAAYGGKILSASNEHYGPAAQIISPYPPLNMFDGFESARSREKGHFEEVVIELGKSGPVHRIEVDFTFFRNNNPRELILSGFSEGKWLPLIERTAVKSYAGNRIRFDFAKPVVISQLRATVFPDGGMNRIHVFGRKD